MRKPFMVEFSGTPEAGKTTAIKNIANKLVSKGYIVSRFFSGFNSFTTNSNKA